MTNAEILRRLGDVVAWLEGDGAGGVHEECLVAIGIAGSLVQAVEECDLGGIEREIRRLIAERRGGVTVTH